ncbi:unnamed protein product [Prorocentrum cordatum]|uniref:Uncharacterized protein n=1 Tax=Prorocentrum cordatum TaxID=2364126 RepID=A0ABN9PBE2_9DINO|nr:unnamed protein product [Polarella glacialis]
MDGVRLVQSCFRGDAEHVAEALRARADPQRAQPPDGYTPLLAAASAGHAGAVALLLGVRADPCAAERAGRSALLLAAAHAHLGVVRQVAAWIGTSQAQLEARPADREPTLGRRGRGAQGLCPQSAIVGAVKAAASRGVKRACRGAPPSLADAGPPLEPLPRSELAIGQLGGAASST